MTEVPLHSRHPAKDQRPKGTSPRRVLRATHPSSPVPDSPSYWPAPARSTSPAGAVRPLRTDGQAAQPLRKERAARGMSRAARSAWNSTRPVPVASRRSPAMAQSASAPMASLGCAVAWQGVRQRLFGPYDLAVGHVAHSPALAEHGDQSQSAPAFVGVSCATDARGGEASVRDFADEAAAAGPGAVAEAAGVAYDVAPQVLLPGLGEGTDRRGGVDGCDVCLVVAPDENVLLPVRAAQRRLRLDVGVAADTKDPSA